MSLIPRSSVRKVMEIMEEADLVAADRFYEKIILKLNMTLAAYKSLPDISRCGETFEVLEQAIHSRDAQINHLLSITHCLLKYMPDSPALEQVFTNFLKDYIHLVNPQMPAFEGTLYLEESFSRPRKQSGASGSHPYHQHI